MELPSFEAIYSGIYLCCCRRLGPCCDIPATSLAAELDRFSGLAARLSGNDPAALSWLNANGGSHDKSAGVSYIYEFRRHKKLSTWEGL